MTRCCEITGKLPMSGNNVSHAKNRTKRRFLPNLQKSSFFSSVLKRSLSILTTARGIRTVEHRGGIDSFLLGTAPTKLSTNLRKFRKEIVAKQEADKAA